MLSSAEHDLTRRNQEIPGLATELDPDAFLAAWRTGQILRSAESMAERLGES